MLAVAYSAAGEFGLRLPLRKAVAAEQEDLGILDEAVGDRSGDGRVVENVAPVGEAVLVVMIVERL